MKKTIEINTMTSRNVYPTESLEFVKKIVNKFVDFKISEKAKEIHKQNKMNDYTDELRLYGTKERGIKYHSYYKALEKDKELGPLLYWISNETYGFANFWIKFTISSQDGLILEVDAKDKSFIDKIFTLFENEYGYCHKQNQEEIFDELIHEIRTRGSEDNGEYGIKMGLKAIKLFPDDFWAQFYLGCSYSLNNQHQKALEHLIRATQIDPNNYDAFYNLSKSYLELNDLPKAKEAMEKAHKLTENNHAINYHLALIYDKIGDFVQAKKHYQSTLSTAPEKNPTEKKGIKSYLSIAEKRLKELNKKTK